MKRQDFNNKYNRIDRSKPEIFDEHTEVSCVGYVPRHKVIKAFIAAGKRLDNIQGKYDVYTDLETDDIDIDVTRSKSFDLAEASEIMRRYNIININFETMEYIDEKGLIRKYPSGEVVSSKKEVLEQNEGPSTISRSVLGQLTPNDEGDTSVEDLVNNEQKVLNVKEKK